MADFEGYCTIAEVKNKSIENACTEAEWVAADIQERVNEGYSAIEGSLMLLGFSRAQLLTAQLIKSLNIMYARYAVVRDMYSNVAVEKSSEMGFMKWKKNFDSIIEQIKKNEINLVDAAGLTISAAGVNQAISAKINTDTTPRMIRISDSADWSMDGQDEESAIGVKE